MITYTQVWRSGQVSTHRMAFMSLPEVKSMAGRHFNGMDVVREVEVIENDIIRLKLRKDAEGHCVERVSI